MTKAVIFFTNGTSHKLSFPGYNPEKMQEIAESDSNGYPELTVDHMAIWIER